MGKMEDTPESVVTPPTQAPEPVAALPATITYVSCSAEITPLRPRASSPSSRISSTNAAFKGA